MIAHLAGVPLEEGLLAFAPAASAFVVCVTAALARARSFERRRARRDR